MKTAQKVEPHRDASLWIRPLGLAFRLVQNESGTFIPLDLADVGIRKEKADGDILGELPRKPGDRLQQGDAAVSSLMALINTDHLNANGAEFGDTDQLLHLMLLRISQPHRIEGERCVSDKWWDHLTVDEEVGRTYAMAQAWLISSIPQKAVDVLGNRIVVVILPKAVKLRDYSGKLLVNG